MLILADPRVGGGHPQQKRRPDIYLPLSLCDRYYLGYGTPFGVFFLKFGVVMKCSGCGAKNHNAGWMGCPEWGRGVIEPRPVVINEVGAPKVKKRWVKAGIMDTPMDTNPTGMDTPLKTMDTSMDTKDVSMDTPSPSMDTNYRYRDEEKRKRQMREYMRKVRGTPGGG